MNSDNIFALVQRRFPPTLIKTPETREERQLAKQIIGIMEKAICQQQQKEAVVATAPECSASADELADTTWTDDEHEEEVSADEEEEPEESSCEVEQGSGPKAQATVPYNEPCPICVDDLVDGCHYGVYACGSCKSFFAREKKRCWTIRNGLWVFNNRLKCTCDKQYPLRRAFGNLCRFCRMQKCVQLGMRPGGTKPGRLSKAAKDKKKRANRKKIGKIQRKSVKGGKTAMAKKGNNISRTHSPISLQPSSSAGSDSSSIDVQLDAQLKRLEQLCVAQPSQPINHLQECMAAGPIITSYANFPSSSVNVGPLGEYYQIGVEETQNYHHYHHQFGEPNYVATEGAGQGGSGINNALFPGQYNGFNHQQQFLFGQQQHHQIHTVPAGPVNGHNNAISRVSVGDMLAPIGGGSNSEESHLSAYSESASFGH